MPEAVLSLYARLLAEAGTVQRKLDRGLKAHDVLIVVNAQNDFLEDGLAPVHEATEAVEEQVRLIQHASSVGAKIIAAKAFHPSNHCSFTTKRTAVPPHCIQGTHGAFFCGPVADALAAARAKARERRSNSVHICFKGVSDEISSPGALPYCLEFGQKRLVTTCAFAPDLLSWTGCFELRCSNLDDDIDAHPDIRAMLRRTPVKELMWGLQDGARVFVCGFPFDSAVLDTACSMPSGKNPAYIVFDASRPLYAPSTGKHGGFTTNPVEVHKYLSQHNVSLCHVSDLMKHA